MIPQNQWAVITETTANTSNEEVDDPQVGEGATSVEVFDWELTNGKKTKNNSQLRSACVVCEVKVRFINWSSNFKHFSSWEPALDLFRKKVALIVRYLPS